jgi:OPA family glycerol-3-phosphate transporter-like MFS transporter
MGWISDRSNAKLFLTIGLFGSGLISCFYGVFPETLAFYPALLMTMSLNGWLQGMGWPPCGRVMVHWFTTQERGSKMALWNISHNVGQAIPAILISLGLGSLFGWGSALLLPGILALIAAYLSYHLIEDTPASVGLPPIEVYADRSEPLAPQRKSSRARRHDFYQYILYNPALWALAFANLFVYLTRYAIIDWLPSYLIQVRGFSPESASLSYSLYEISGIAGTLLCGWISDRFFQGRRAPAAVLFLGLVTIVLSVYWQLPSAYVFLINFCLFLLGFLIYGPVMLIGLHALDLVPKSVAGTAAGFTGLFGYVGGATCANALFGWIVQHYGWDGGFKLLLLSCFMSTFFLSLTWHSTAVDLKKTAVRKKNVSFPALFGVK